MHRIESSILYASGGSGEIDRLLRKGEEPLVRIILDARMRFGSTLGRIGMVVSDDAPEAVALRRSFGEGFALEAFQGMYVTLLSVGLMMECLRKPMCALEQWLTIGGTAVPVVVGCPQDYALLHVTIADGGS